MKLSISVLSTWKGSQKTRPPKRQPPLRASARVSLSPIRRPSRHGSRKVQPKTPGLRQAARPTSAPLKMRWAALPGRVRNLPMTSLLPTLHFRPGTPRPRQEPRQENTNSLSTKPLILLEKRPNRPRSQETARQLISGQKNPRGRQNSHSRMRMTPGLSTSTTRRRKPHPPQLKISGSRTNSPSTTLLRNGAKRRLTTTRHSTSMNRNSLAKGLLRQGQSPLPKKVDCISGR